MAQKTNQKAEKALRNEVYAKRFRKRVARTPGGKPSKKEMSNYCRMPGHPRSCEFDACPSWNP